MFTARPAIVWAAISLSLAGLALVQAGAAGAAAPGPSSNVSLRAAAAPLGLGIGSAVYAGAGDYRATALREFSMVTPENSMKWAVLHPQPAVFDFHAADQVVRMAMDGGMRVRGHTLVWHGSLPDWLSQGDFPREEWIRILRQHIATVMGYYRAHYPGVVVQWDVVNEAVADCPGPRPCGLRDTLWLRKIGPEYIAMAFRFAREADPSAKLYYNDYGTESGYPSAIAKRDGMLLLLAGLLAQGVPIDGVGLQFHIGLGAPASDYLADLFQRIAALKLDVAVTELDVALGAAPGAQPGQLQQQAAVYRDVLEACLGQPRCRTFMVWGFTDAASWRAAEAPCIFDSQLQPKPAYVALRDELLQRRRPGPARAR